MCDIGVHTEFQLLKHKRNTLYFVNIFIEHIYYIFSSYNVPKLSSYGSIAPYIKMFTTSQEITQA